MALKNKPVFVDKIYKLTQNRAPLSYSIQETQREGHYYGLMRKLE